jgi:hypothetical protein
MPLSGRSAVITIAHESPSSTSQKYSNELNLSATSASAALPLIHHRAEQAADRREHQPGAQRELGLALVRHCVRLVGIRGRGGRAGHAQQTTRDVS